MMNTKFLGTVLIVLTVLGGIRLFQNMTFRTQAEGSEELVIRQVSDQVEGIMDEVNAQLRDLEQGEMVSGEVMIEEVFKVRPGSDLNVDIAHADVDIVTGSGNEASIKVTLNARNMDRARDRFEDMNWKVYQEGGDVFVTAEWPRKNWRGNLDIDVLISIPQTFNLALQTTHGDVELGDISGEVDLATTHGEVDFGEMDGDFVHIRSSHGNITGDSISSERVDVETSHANITIEDINARDFEARTSHADVAIRNLTGESQIATSHGNILVFLAGSEDASFETSHGNIEVNVDSNGGADLDLRAPRIRLDRDMNVRGEHQQDRIEGAMNGGGRSIRARTTHGSIELNGK